MKTAGVDRIDQMISYYPTVRKSCKWVKKLFFWFLELAIHNAHIVHMENMRKRGHRGRRMTLLEFQMELVTRLCCQVNVNNNLSLIHI